MSWHVSMVEVGDCSVEIFYLITGDMGPGKGAVTVILPRPVALEMC